MAKLPRSLHGRVVVITGGGRGIGKAIARALARQGLPRRDRRPRRRVAREAAATSSAPSTSALALDVTDRRASRRSSTRSNGGSVRSTSWSTTPGSWRSGRSTRRTSATAAASSRSTSTRVIHGTKEAVRRMKPRGTRPHRQRRVERGQDRLPEPRHLLRDQARRRRHVRGLRGELRGTGVEISVVMPGIVRTELGPGSVETRGFKMSTPEEVADVVVDGPRVPALRRLRAEVDRPDLGGAAGRAAPRPRGDRRALKIDRALLDADRDARAVYEARAAASAPAAERERETV